MAELTLTLTTTQGTLNSTRTPSEANAARVVAYAEAVHGEDEDGNARTTAEAVQAMLDGYIQGIVNNVIRHEKQVAEGAVPEPSDLT